MKKAVITHKDSNSLGTAGELKRILNEFSDDSIVMVNGDNSIAVEFDPAAMGLVDDAEECTGNCVNCSNNCKDNQQVVSAMVPAEIFGGTINCEDVDSLDQEELAFEEGLPECTRMNIMCMRNNNKDIAARVADYAYKSTMFLLEYLVHANAHIADSVITDARIEMCHTVDDTAEKIIDTTIEAINVATKKRK